MDMLDHTRRKMGKGKKTSGGCLENNSTVRVFCKASAKNRDHKKKDIDQDFHLLAMGAANSGIPSDTEGVKAL